MKIALDTFAEATPTTGAGRACKACSTLPAELLAEVDANAARDPYYRHSYATVSRWLESEGHIIKVASIRRHMLGHPKA